MGSRKKTQTVGYRYGLTVHMGVCYGPVDSVQKILADDRDAYTSTVTSTQTVNINKGDLFGGDEKEGGLRGQMHIQMGDSAQTPSPLLTAQLGTNIPAFRGILGFVYKGIMSANNPYLKPFSFIVRRILSGWQNGLWYSSKALINGRDANPAHIVYECLTNSDWGMGYPTASIDDANFRQVADVLYDEGFGLSLIWAQQSTLESFLTIIFNHIAGSLNIDPRTGLYQIKLVRQDYDPGTLPIFDQDSIVELVSYQRAGWGELVGEVTVKFTDPVTFEETATTVQNLATIQAQEGVIPQVISFTGITSAELASRVAQRELIARSSPLAKVKIKVKRKAWNQLPNDVFKFSWPKLGITAMVMRVASVDTGSLDSGVITIEALEDVFGMPANSYVGQQGNEWENPLQPPAAAPYRLFREVTFLEMVRTLSPADLSYIDPDDGFPIMYASRPGAGYYDYTLRIDGADVDQGDHCAVAVVAGGLDKEEFTTLIISVNDSSQVTVGEYAAINDEYVRIDSFNDLTGEITLARGVIDTVPREHPANSVLFFGDGASTTDPTASPIGAFLQAKVITRTGMGTLDPVMAPTDTLMIQARHNKPYPPAKFRINGQYLPNKIKGSVTLSWNERNRVIQDRNILDQAEASLMPEDGTTYTIRIFDQDNVLCRTLTGLTGNSYTYPQADELVDCGGMQTHITVQLFSVRDGVESYQYHEHRFEREYDLGWGFNFGGSWGN
ncbi:phage tail protein [Acinetobacter sp.]|uniref:phage tail protein n=1 Tax=Acinetobacter sp. TaxID=472 RepID=UPI002FD93326